MPKLLNDERHRPRDGEDFECCPSRWVEPMWNPKFDGTLELAETRREREVSAQPWVLLLDDGDLRDVTRMLRSYRVPIAINMQGAPHRDELPCRLLVATGSRALRFDRAVLDKRDRVTTVAVVSEPDPVVSRQIGRLGFDYVIERPVDSDALRHLLHGALFRGTDQRSEPRFAAGCVVHHRLRWRRRPAMLLELSRRGCTLRVEGTPRLGRRIHLTLPDQLTGERARSLAASIVRSEVRGSHAYVAAVFRRDPVLRTELGAMLGNLRRGPLKLAS